MLCVGLLLAAGNPPKGAVFLCIVSLRTSRVDRAHVGTDHISKKMVAKEETT